MGLGSNPLKFIDPTGEEIILWYSKGTDNSGTKFLYEKGKISQKTAIALNYILNTKEGFNYFSQFAKKGQKIAEMGNTGADQVKLHFEIRRQGKPVDPLKYLPPRK